jgi:hypothetical protein
LKRFIVKRFANPTHQGDRFEFSEQRCALRIFDGNRKLETAEINCGGARRVRESPRKASAQVSLFLITRERRLKGSEKSCF